MKKWLIVFSVLCLSENSAWAEEEYIEQDAVAELEDVTSRLTSVTPEQYIEMTAPIHREARRQAQSLSEKEARALIAAQNHINRRVSQKSNEPEPEAIDIDPTDTDAMEKFLTPEHMYTYDDLPIKYE